MSLTSFRVPMGLQVRFEAKVTENGAQSSDAVLNGTKLSLRDLPHVFGKLMGDLESTELYKRKPVGAVSFDLSTVGTAMAGYHLFVREGRTLTEMFRKVSELEYANAPFDQRVLFTPGDQQLRVTVARGPGLGAGHIHISGSYPAEQAASATVIKHLQPKLWIVRREAEPFIELERRAA